MAARTAARLDGGSIRIVGARENNLKNVSLEIPRNAITVFVGASGSGKSSIVFDTIAVEAQRQLNATFPWFIRNQLPRHERPHVDSVHDLTTPVVVDQRPLGGTVRSTVGTVTDIHPQLRALFARCGSPSAGRPSAYSFNDAAGMCPDCEGLGRTLRPDPALMLDPDRSLQQGAILVPGYPVGSPGWQFYANHEGIDPDKALRDYSAEETELLLHGSTGEVQLTFKNGRTQTLAFEGLVSNFTRRHLKRDTGSMSERSRATAERFLAEQQCPACHGARLNSAALATTIAGRSIAGWCALEVRDLVALIGTIEDERVAATAAGVRDALQRIVAIGLGYLSLDRPASTLSGGEGQRLKLVKHLGSDLTQLIYIFDEPSAGLHPRDVGRLNDVLRALRDKGNTVLVVEHDPDVIDVADHVVEIGPRAGAHGGEVVFTGTCTELRTAGTLTADGLARGGAVKERPRTPTGALPVRGASVHNLKDVSVDVPTGVFTVVTGVAGSGKSSLVTHFRSAHPDAVLVDQAPIAVSSRSTPATYLGLMDRVRKSFAEANGTDAALFSFNSKGACGACQGRGELITEVSYMDPIRSRCESCEGRRFRDDVLAHALRGKSVADVLDMSVDEATEFFTEKPIRSRLRTLGECGLGYLGLGQALSTLSGGERQRLKLADQLTGGGRVYVLDEPTTGLHVTDVAVLLDLLDRMVDTGSTVVVVEHDLAVVQRADWVIDLGPGGGRDGGEVVFTGTPEKLLGCEHSTTGEHLRRYLAA